MKIVHTVADLTRFHCLEKMREGTNCTCAGIALAGQEKGGGKMRDRDPEDVIVTAAVYGQAEAPTKTRLSRKRGTLHRLHPDKACNQLYRRQTKPYESWWERETTDLKSAAEGSKHHLCRQCEWPDGARDVLEQYGDPPELVTDRSVEEGGENPDANLRNRIIGAIKHAF